MQNSSLISVALDGPAGAGKTSVAEALSKKLDILYLNTGAMYRAAGLRALRLHIDPLNEKDVLTFLSDLEIDVKYENGKQHTLLNGEDVTNYLSDETVGEYASKISSLVPVREKMVSIQQNLAKKRSLIIDGRDIGTVVLPNASHKFYLDAKVEERAKRRYNEYQTKGKLNYTYEQILEEMKERDYRDMSRAHSPLKKADDAVYIDSTEMSLEKVINTILNYFKK